MLSAEDLGKLDILADKVLYSLEQPTEQCHLLAECIRKGCAFHHAGLFQKQKDLVEKGFREKFLKIICATPTLAAGVNLPAFRVIVRFSGSGFEGSYYIPVLEVTNVWQGGRPGLESPEAVALVKSEYEKKEILTNTLIAKPRMYSTSLNRTLGHVLHCEFNFARLELDDFFKSTFLRTSTRT